MGDLPIQVLAQNQFRLLEESLQHASLHNSCSGRCRSLLQHVAQQAGQGVVILVGAYDKPILDTLQQSLKR